MPRLAASLELSCDYFADGEARPSPLLPPFLELREEAEQLEVEPDERHEQAEGPVPLHVLRCAAIRASFDEVEVEDQVEGSDRDHDQAEADPDRRAAADEGDTGAEEVPPARRT